MNSTQHLEQVINMDVIRSAHITAARSAIWLRRNVLGLPRELCYFPNNSGPELRFKLTLLTILYFFPFGPLRMFSIGPPFTWQRMLRQAVVFLLIYWI